MEKEIKTEILLEKANEEISIRIGKQGKKELLKQAKEKGLNTTQYIKMLIIDNIK